MSNLNRVLILFAHPALEKSRVNRHLIQAVRELEAITVHDLYEVYPDFHIDVKYEQNLLVAHDIIVFQHPFYWYSSPALLKEWQDLVLEYDFAYGHRGTALAGKKFLSAITTGGSENAYCREGHNRFSIRELLVPFEQTASLCGMEYLPPFVIYGTHRLREQQQINNYANDYRSIIVALRDNTVNWDLLRQSKSCNQNLTQMIQRSEVTHNAQ